MDHKFFNEKRPLTRAEALLCVLVTVNHKDEDVLIGNQIIKCKRGESIRTMESWRKLFRWASRHKVRAFFDVLESTRTLTRKTHAHLRAKYTHISVCNYDKYQNGGTLKGHLRDTQGTFEGHKQEDKEEKNKKICQKMYEFDEARKIYPGTKRGNETEFENFTKKHKTWESLLPLLRPAIEKQIAYRRSVPQGTFVPQWKNFQTWINQRCWEEEVGCVPKAPKQQEFDFEEYRRKAEERSANHA